jgi:hypothetical protein
MTIALEQRAAASLYSAIMIAFIALAFVLQASFLAALASGVPLGAPAAPPPVQRAALPAVAPCVNL